MYIWRTREWCAAPLLIGLVSALPAYAQVGAIGGVGTPAIEAPPVDSGRPDSFINPSRPDDALIAGGWLLYPSAFIGGIVDTNVNQTARGQSSAGIRITPSLLAENSGDLSKTTIYGVADSRIYFGSAASNADDVDVSSGVIETFQPLPDLIFSGQADYTRQKDLFNTLGDTHAVTNLNPTGIGLAPLANPVAYNQLTAAGTVQKNFAEAFVILGGSVVGQIYDQNFLTNNQSPDNITYTGTLRGGWWLTPAVYGYLEGDGDSRNESVGNLSSSGYRTVGGFGTDQIGLVKGSIYAGYQAENYNAGAIGTIGSPVAGVRGFYYPLPELTLNVSVDETLGVSLLAPATTLQLGTATRVTTALATAEYALAEQWTASGRGGYIHTDYIDNPRRDDAWTLGGTLTYQLTRSLGLTADYQHTELSSNIVAQGFDRDVVTFGVTVKY
jgi:hypothetical protein